MRRRLILLKAPHPSRLHHGKLLPALESLRVMAALTPARARQNWQIKFHKGVRGSRNVSSATTLLPPLCSWSQFLASFFPETRSKLSGATSGSAPTLSVSQTVATAMRWSGTMAVCAQKFQCLPCGDEEQEILQTPIQIGSQSHGRCRRPRAQRISRPKRLALRIAVRRMQANRASFRLRDIRQWSCRH